VYVVLFTEGVFLERVYTIFLDCSAPYEGFSTSSVSCMFYLFSCTVPFSREDLLRTPANWLRNLFRVRSPSHGQVSQSPSTPWLFKAFRACSTLAFSLPLAPPTCKRAELARSFHPFPQVVLHLSDHDLRFPGTILPLTHLPNPSRESSGPICPIKPSHTLPILLPSCPTAWARVWKCTTIVEGPVFYSQSGYSPPW